MLKAIIIEDEQNAALLLENMIKDVGPEITVIDSCRDLPSGVKSIKRNYPDIVFLDVELPIYSGIQLLEFFNEEELIFGLIFTTASNEYAIRAFEMSAVDYLTKPIKEDKLRIAIEKVLKAKPHERTTTLPILTQNLQNKVSTKIVVPIASGFEILDLGNICYVKAEGSYSLLHLNGKTNLLVSKNLKHFELILSGSPNFIRIHRSYIVNLDYAKRILKTDGGAIILDDKTEIPVSEDKMPFIIELLNCL